MVCGLAGAVSTSHLTAASGDTRTLSLYNIHNKETTSVLYKKDGRIVPGALDKLNWALRDWRRDEKTTMDPGLIDLLWEMHAELGSKEPIHVISAFRSRGTNDMLRKTVGGQASESRHILGRAADVHFPDVPIKKLRYSALIRERGGVGYYPTSALPFVHVDTDRVRAWPRLPRYELALLFPSGRTQHLPADGGPITISDVRVAQAQHRDLAVQVAAYHSERKAPGAGAAIALVDASAGRADQRRADQSSGAPVLQRVAALTPPVLTQPAPILVEAPRVVDRPSRLTAPSATERSRLADLFKTASLLAAPQLAERPRPAQRRAGEPVPPPSLSGAIIQAALVAEGPRVAALDPIAATLENDRLTDPGQGWGNGFVQAPAFDEEHPEELAYRPFPIAPLMTETASADDPALVTLHHPDAARSLEMLDAAGAMLPMRLRPSSEVAALMYSQQFRGEAINLAALSGDALPVASGLSSRKVNVSAR